MSRHIGFLTSFFVYLILLSFVSSYIFEFINSVTLGTTERSGETQRPEPENSFAGEAVRQIESLVESFRTGKSKKPQTIFEIGQVLAAQSSGDEQLKSDSLDRYAA